MSKSTFSLFKATLNNDGVYDCVLSDTVVEESETDYLDQLSATHNHLLKRAQSLLQNEAINPVFMQTYLSNLASGNTEYFERIQQHVHQMRQSLLNRMMR